jgi:hypothetical protein
VSPTIYEYNPVNPARHKQWLSGYAPGASAITVESLGDLSVGRLIYLDQLNDTNTTATSTGGGAPGLGLYSSLSYPTNGQDRYQQQVARVTSINGTTLTITPPLCMPNWQAPLSPGIWWMSANPLEGVGVEDLWVQGTDSANYPGYGLNFENCYGCWAKNVKVSFSSRHIYTEFCSRMEIRHCHIETNPGSGPSNYGFSIFHTSGALIEDNICNAIQSPLLLCGVSGSVFGYNYMTNFLSWDAWMTTAISTHGNHPNMNLFEGNYADMLSLDNQWGSSIYNTAFRNRLTGCDESDMNTYNNRQAVTCSSGNRFENIVGNVLGTTGINTFYESYNQNSGCHENGRVYFLGSLYSWCSIPGSDPVVYSSLLRVLNWDSANHAIFPAIAPGGYQLSDLPASLYQPSKPAWFGSLKWPAIDPADPVYSGSRTNIPAGYRFIFGQDPVGGGPVNLTPVVAASYSPSPVKAGTNILFSSAGSYDPEGTSLTYLWTFGDGGNSTGANPLHPYATTGAFTATLTVSDGLGTSSTNVSISVLPAN